ncbi:MAG: hypothetical protein ACT4NU_03435 [Chromatiales bacterium]
MRQRPILWTICLLFGLGGCAAMQSTKKINQLHDATNAYRILLRWGKYEDATYYIVFRPGRGQPRKVDLDALRSIRLASYDIVEQIVAPDESEATFKVTMTYYHEESNVLHTLRDVQIWWYSDEQKRWFLGTDFPDFVGDLQKDL